ncbi:MAG: ABC transporter ATP-binding protein [Cyclobacteriaceae bacterium]|nr:ABC transporter ATP-binding protein [Cyclobacteriaceae bacterium]
MSNTVIQVSNLSKLYRLGEVGTGTISHDLNRWWSKVRGKEDPFAKVGTVNDRTQKAEKGEHVWALRDINFKVEQGEVLGIIGKNGAGKSTLLKLLSRVTSPTTGEIKAKGRIASLLEVGTGFNPEMTGRENIYMNGTILGMRRREITAKLDDIVDFAGVAKYLDTPTKRYSSGMTVRLGFAVAAFLEPEILIVDEVLAVGDAEFQKRAIGKMQDISKGGGRTVLFVSHNMGSVNALCTKAIILTNGKVTTTGNVDKVIQEYLNAKVAFEGFNFKNRFNESNKPIAYYAGASVKNKEGSHINTAIAGEPLSIELEYVAESNDLPLHFYIGVYNGYGDKILHLGSPYSKEIDERKIKKKGIVTCHFDKLPLPEGNYTFNISLHHTNSSVDIVRNAFRLTVENGDFFGTGKIPPSSVNKILIDQKWIVN